MEEREGPSVTGRRQWRSGGERSGRVRAEEALHLEKRRQRRLELVAPADNALGASVERCVVLSRGQDVRRREVARRCDQRLAAAPAKLGDELRGEDRLGAIRGAREAAVHDHGTDLEEDVGVGDLLPGHHPCAAQA